ncbi:MAG TPA: sulfotransferase, partial [Acetobacteraceae bacterium]|nr:sulfotransferase [Acetobacteraceae bacterium]
MTSSIERAYAAVEAHDTIAAIGWFEKALAENPDHAEAKAWLGQSLCSVGRLDEGTAYLRQAGQHFLRAAAGSGGTSLALELVEELQHWRDFAGALELGQRAVEINPSEPRGWQLLTLTYSQLNRLPEALDAGRRAVELAPDNTMMQILQGSLEADARQNDAARGRLEAVLGRQPTAQEEFRTRKELARVLDNLGAYDQVFSHLHASARLSAALPEFSEQDAAFIPNLLKASKTGFDRELLGRWSGTAFPPDQPAPIFVIGFMRSGTTLTQEILDAHPDIFVADEEGFVPALNRELHRMEPGGASVADKLRRLDRPGVLRLRALYWKLVRQRFGGAIGQRAFVDKFTMNTVDLGLINVIFPDAKVVFVMRDPRDVCISCFMQLMVPSQTTVHLLTWRGTAEFYALVMDWWMHVKPLLTLDVIEFRYEDAVTQFEPVFRRVFDFLGLRWEPAVADFHENVAGKFIASPSRNQVAQPLYSSSVARWRHFEREFAPVAGLLEPFIRAFDYEP